MANGWFTGRRVGRGGRPLRLALRPLRAKGNSFAGLFADHLSRRNFEVVPFSWDELDRGGHDVVLIHWPTEFFRPDSRKATLSLLWRLARAKVRHGTRIVWLVHNIHPHDGGSMSSTLTARIFLGLLDGTIFLSQTSRDELHGVYPSSRRLRELVTVHGLYPAVASAARSFDPAQARGRLLYFGVIRDYKNVTGLVRAACGVTVKPFTLRVTGYCADPDLHARIRDLAQGDPRIELDIRDDFVSPEELEQLIDACDGVVLPYKRILNSGSAIHALSRYRPILAPAIGSLTELRSQIGDGWVHLFKADIDAEAIEAFLAGISALQAPSPNLAPFEWTRIGEAVSDFLSGF